MPLIPSLPAGGPTAPASTGNRAVARSGDQDTAQPGSFGEAMARSREAGRETTVDAVIRPAISKATRRPADAEKSAVQDSASPMAALLVNPLGNQLDAMVKASAASAATSLDTATATATATAIATTSTATATTSTAAATSLSGGAAVAGLDGNPGTPAAPGLSQPLLTRPASLGDAPAMLADSNAQAAFASGLAALASTSADSAPAHAQETASRKVVPRSADPGDQAALAPVLAVNVSKAADPVPALTRDTATGLAMPVAADPPAVTALAGAANAGPRDTSSGQGEEGAKSQAALLEGRAGSPLQAADITNFADGSVVALTAAPAPQQPGSAFAPSVPASTVSGTLLPDVGSSEWGKALSQQVIRLSTGEGQMAELQLNPPGLGPLKVMLSLSDQQMQAAFVSAHSSVRAAVETALPQLRALLAESGISLGQTSVGAETQPQTAFASGQGSFSRQSPRQYYPGKDAGMADVLFDQPAAVMRRPGQGLRIDTYA